MTSRERLLRALRRDSPDRVPMYFSFTPAVAQEFERRTGADAASYQDYFGFDLVSREPAALLRRHPELPASWQAEGGDAESGDVRTDEWGIGYRRGSIFHFEHILYPLAGATSVSEIERYPYPAVDTHSPEYEAFRRSVRETQRLGRAVVSSGQAVGGTLFWPAYKLRGMEQLFVDMHESPALAASLLERVESIVGEICEAKAAAGVDVLLLADDFGTQRDLLMSLELWDRWFRDGLERIIARSRRANPDLTIAFHSDGAVERLITRLMDIGVDVLNPVQPECMDIVSVKRSYGDRLSFWGTIGTQTTMPFGTPGDVTRAVRHSIEHVGRGGGLLIAPTHVLEPEVPWENIESFVRAVREHGTYR